MRLNFIGNLILAMALGFASCTGDQVEPKFKSADHASPMNKEEEANKKVNQDLEQVARALAKITIEPEVREFIRHEAMKQFDGDYDILYRNVARHTFADGLTLQAKFKALHVDIERIATQIPKLQISVPVNCEEWNPATYTPLVAIAPYGVQETEIKAIKSFDSNSKVHWLAADKDPDEPVIVAGVSERVDEKGNVAQEFVKPEPKASKGTRGTGRLPGSFEKMHAIKIKNLSAIESWTAGRLELKLYTVNTEEQVAVANRYTWEPKRKWVDNKDWEVNDGLFSWQQAYGEYFTYRWLEVDGMGGMEAFHITVVAKEPKTGSEMTLVFDPQKWRLDDDCGGVMIHKSEPKFRRYGSNLNWVLTYE
ncbi:MAG TPA: hypothetical protein VEX63_10915 [Flavisolibacter sp.]|nr:hypothetical protein [Flavisolibacter sp.]